MRDLLLQNKILQAISNDHNLSHTRAIADYLNADIVSVLQELERLEEQSFITAAMLRDLSGTAFSNIKLTNAGYDHLDSLSIDKDIVAGENMNKQTSCENKIFIGHGQSDIWRELKDFLVDRLNLSYEEFNRTSVAGIATKERLEEMLNESSFAFLVMTAEDQTEDGKMNARLNVVHEVGLFQGRLGFKNAIILLENGCEDFSNIKGLTHIPFPKGNISAVYEDIRRVLEREKLITK